MCNILDRSSYEICTSAHRTVKTCSSTSYSQSVCPAVHYTSHLFSDCILLNFSDNGEIDQLADGHAFINANGCLTDISSVQWPQKPTSPFRRLHEYRYPIFQLKIFLRGRDMRMCFGDSCVAPRKYMRILNTIPSSGISKYSSRYVSLRRVYFPDRLRTIYPMHIIGITSETFSIISQLFDCSFRNFFQ